MNRRVHVSSWFRLRTVCLAVAVMAGVWGLTTTGAAKSKGKSQKLDRFLAGLSADAGDVRVIVTAAKGRRDDVGQTLARKQRHIIAEHTSIDAFSVSVPAGALEELVADPAVAHVSVDAPIKSFAVNEVGMLNTNMLLPTLALPYSGYTGNGVGVAVLDSGIVNNVEVPVAAFYDLIASEKPAKPFDKFGHGTHVAGLITDDWGFSDALPRTRG
jgi:subtilisin family serine protease